MIATGDSGPLRHRYGGVRDLVVGMTVILSDGTIAKSGGKVIKNVAGYDLAKLFAGSYGTLGLIASVAVRLHPLPGAQRDRDRRRRRPDDARPRRPPRSPRCRSRPTRSTSRWDGDRGHLLVRFGGAAAEQAGGAPPSGCARLGLADARAEARGRRDLEPPARRQRSADGIVLKVSGRPTDLPAVIAAPARSAAGRLARRARLSWLALPAGADVAAVREALRRAPGRGARRRRDASPMHGPRPRPGALAVMARLKERFDPARIFRPGAYVGGL